MDSTVRTDLYFGLFRWHPAAEGRARVTLHDQPPRSIPDPQTGRHLRIATVEVSTPAICPACASRGGGGFVSFESDLRLAYACPHCRQLVWVAGA